MQFTRLFTVLSARRSLATRTNSHAAKQLPELDVGQLKQVAGGGPNGTWAAAAATGAPNGTWAVRGPNGTW